MTTHPIRRLIANAIARHCLCICDEQFVKALLVLWQALENCESLLPPAIRAAWRDVKIKSDRI